MIHDMHEEQQESWQDTSHSSACLDGLFPSAFSLPVSTRQCMFLAPLILALIEASLLHYSHSST
jgi:hypothetical protein